MTEPVYVLGGLQTDFARNWAREGHDHRNATDDEHPPRALDQGLRVCAHVPEDACGISHRLLPGASRRLMMRFSPSSRSGTLVRCNA